MSLRRDGRRCWGFMACHNGCGSRPPNDMNYLTLASVMRLSVLEDVSHGHPAQPCATLSGSVISFSPSETLQRDGTGYEQRTATADA